MPDDHSKLVPLLPIPNRTVKRLCADDSAGSRVKVGHRQALTAKTPGCAGRFLLSPAEQGREENAKSVESAAKTVLQYKASLITASQKQNEKSPASILKNIQPISVGV